jgi:protein O-mannosyl-transferase
MHLRNPLKMSIFSMRFLQKNIKSIGLIFILLVTVVIYSGSIKNGYTNWDDQEQVYENKDIRQFDFFHVKKIFSGFYVGMYQPLTTLSFATEYAFFGANPKANHTTNLLFHLINTVLLFILFIKITGNHKVALFVSLFFAIHPMHTESVCWISERKDVLYSAFLFLSLIWYYKYLKERRSFRNIFLCFIFFVFSLLSKSAAIILPLLLILFDYYFARKFDTRNVMEKLIFLLVAFGFGILSIHSQGALNEGAGKIQYFSFINRIVIAFFSLGFYLFNFFIPCHLSAFHPYPSITASVLPLKYYLSALGVIILIMGMIFLFRNNKLSQKIKSDLIFGLLFFCLTIFIVIQVPVGQAVVAERYTYLPYIGLLFILGQFFFDQNGIFQTGFYKKIFVALFIMVVVLFSIISFSRTKIWKDSFTLYDDIINKYANRVEFAYNSRGLAYFEKKQYLNAVNDYNKALVINPTYAEVYNNRGLVSTDIGQYNQAIADFSEAIRQKTDFPCAYLNRAIAKENLNDYMGALKDYSAAIKLDNKYVKAYMYRGDDKIVLGDYSGAVQDYSVVVQIEPNNSEGFFKRGGARQRISDLNGACSDWNKASESGYEGAKELLSKYCN